MLGFATVGSPHSQAVVAQSRPCWIFASATRPCVPPSAEKHVSIHTPITTRALVLSSLELDIAGGRERPPPRGCSRDGFPYMWAIYTSAFYTYMVSLYIVSAN